MGEAMKKNPERIYDFLKYFSVDDVKEAYIFRMYEEKNREFLRRKWLTDNGYVQIEAQQGELLTSDGREIFWAAGEPFALTVKENEARREAAFVAAGKVRTKESGAKTTNLSESLSNVLCQCGGSLNKKEVGGGCFLGKAGYRFEYSCDSCAMKFVSTMEIDNECNV